ncbi:MAG: low molecular weight protein arginine phosphatase [Candidatus Omnitrophota bacterium]|nr:low molecular weight protein arginine phosphatase [Candidatus Omnitrophota bacterium]
MKDIKHILFVCTGNSCRSIMAEGYLNKRSEEEGIPVEVKSAGTLGLNGLPPTKEALRVLANAGIDPQGYESKELTDKIIEWADMILVMEPEHKTRILNMVPGIETKVHYLGEFNPNRVDIIIPDPIGRPLAFYRASFRLIREAVEELIKWLKK